MRGVLSGFSTETRWWGHLSSSVRLSKRNVLRAGYGALLAFLVFSAVEAYQIQRSAARQTAEIYYRHRKAEDILYRCRRFFFVGGIHARDFLLNTDPDRAVVFKAEMTQLHSDFQKAITELDDLPALKPFSPVLRKEMQEFWDVLNPIAEWNDRTRTAQGFGFVQREVVPRRNAAGHLLRGLTEASENALKDSEAEFALTRESAVIRLLLILALCLVCGATVAHLSLSYSESLERESAQRFEELSHTKRDLERLSARLLEVQEEERKRISRELHDEIGQTFTALRIEVSHVQSACGSRDPEISKSIERARALADRGLRTVRDISLLLRPPLLDDLGIAPALQWQAEDFICRTKIPCEFSEQGLPDDLPDSHKTCIYRIVQEALRNCETHAAASSVRISIRHAQQRLTVEVEDDGRGFEAISKKDGRVSGLGIMGMCERAAMLGGTLHVRSLPGIGTRVTLSLPLPEAEPASQVGADVVKVSADANYNPVSG